ncbi:hypothetical protein SLA2020_320260 [Shorea laevis]
MGDGTKTRFSKDVWLGNSSFMFDFPRFFNLTQCKDSLVVDLKPTNVDGWALQWRRTPFGKELDELRVLEDILKNVVILEDKVDQFIWKHSMARYSTKQAYIFLENCPSCPDNSFYKIIWSPFMPSKVSFFTWRLLLNQVHTKGNLIIHGVHLVSNPNYVLCKEYVDDLNHIFASCRYIQNIWKQICY